MRTVGMPRFGYYPVTHRKTKFKLNPQALAAWAQIQGKLKAADYPPIPNHEVEGEKDTVRILVNAKAKQSALVQKLGGLEGVQQSGPNQLAYQALKIDIVFDPML